MQDLEWKDLLTSGTHVKRLKELFELSFKSFSKLDVYKKEVVYTMFKEEGYTYGGFILLKRRFYFIEYAPISLTCFPAEDDLEIIGVKSFTLTELKKAYKKLNV